MDNPVIEGLVHTYGLAMADAVLIAANTDTLTFFERTCGFTRNFATVAHWLNGPIRGFNKSNSGEIDIRPEALAALVNLVDAETLSYKAAVQQVLPEMMNGSVETPLEIATRLNLMQLSDEVELSNIIDQVLHELPLKVEAFHSGKKGILSMFMGEVMQRTQGRANPKIASRLLTDKLKSTT